MKEEEVIRKLKNTRLPDIEIGSHRRRLKMALLNSGYLQKQPGSPIMAPQVNVFKGGLEIMRRGLLSRQPVWKSAIVSVMALVLISGLAVIFIGSGQSAAAMAADIAKDSPQVRAALGGVPIQEVAAIKVADGKGTVLVRGVPGPASAAVEVIAEVNMETRQVTSVIPAHDFSFLDEQKAIDIARSHPQVKELLGQGAVVSQVLPLFPITEENLDSGQANASVPLALVIVEKGIERWAVKVDLLNEKVLSLGQTTNAVLPSEGPSLSASVAFWQGPLEQANRQVNCRINVTNLSQEILTDVRIRLATATNGKASGEMEIEAWPLTPGPVALTPGSSRMYSATWHYEVDKDSEETYTRLFNSIRITAEYTMPEGNARTQALYPSLNTPPEATPAARTSARE